MAKIASKRGLSGKKDTVPVGGCPDCGGAWRYVEGDVHYHQTYDWTVGAEGQVVEKEDAYWEDSGSSSEGLLVERFLECSECYAHWEL